MIPVNDIKRGLGPIKDKLINKSKEVIESGWYVLGKEVEIFEENFAKSLNTKYCIGVDNGLNAIKLGIEALGITKGDEVIVQSNAYIATVIGITRNDATPIFCEPDEYFNMDPYKIEELITSKTKALLVTHLYGQTTRMKKYLEICKKYNLYLLEDCAQSHYSKYDGKYSGTFGDLGFFSFYPTKNMGAIGDAGAVTTNREDLALKIKKLRNYGSIQRYKNEMVGHNSRLDEIQAGFLNIKLEFMKQFTDERISIATRYNNEITNPLITKPIIAKGATSVYHLYVIKLENRDKFRDYMLKNGVKTDIHYPQPVHLTQAYQYLNYKVGDFPIAERNCELVCSIPLFNGMKKEEIDKVIEVINRYEE